MRLLYVVFIALIFTSCTKGYVAPVTITKSATKTDSVKNIISAVKVDSVKSSDIISDTDTSNPNYWYNGTTGTAVIKVTCTDCTALATIGTQTIPFLFNANGVGVLKYMPAAGLPIKLAVCPAGNKAIKAEVLDSNGASLYSYSGVISSNWAADYAIK